MYNFLLIEDDIQDSSLFQDTVKRLNIESEKEQYHLEIAETYEKGMKMASDHFNGIIVDIKLDKNDDNHSGNDIIQEIVKKFRVPIVIFTGTPNIEQNPTLPIKVYKKGDAKHEDILRDLCAVLDTGLFNVLGRTGKIETFITKVFWNNLYPQVNLWIEKKAKGIDTEKVLLRYAISHILEHIDEDVPQYVTEEMYIKPPISQEIKTGAIFQSSHNKKYCIVLSPPCDLAKHDGKFKTDSILVCEIDNHDTVNIAIVNGATKKEKRIKRINDAIKNNFTDYYHWLPKNTLFEGGYINFRKVNTYTPEAFVQEYKEPIIKIQEYFMKNILNRFSSYYARQGQPDFDFTLETKAILDKIVPEEKS